MAICFQSSGPRGAVRLACAAVAVVLLAGCSSDVTRFNDPLGNPFQDASGNSDKTPTGSIPPQSALAYPKSAAINSQPLGAPVAAYQAPAHTSPNAAPILPTRSVASTAPTGRAQPMAAATASHWSPQGGAPVVVGKGETVAILATRYGVPTDALLRVNGFTSAAQIQPGTHLTIPVYDAGSAAAAAPAAAPTEAKRQATATSPMHFVRGPAPKTEPAPAAAASVRPPAAMVAKRPAAKSVAPKTVAAQDPKTKDPKNKDAKNKDVKTKSAAAVPPAKVAPTHVAAAPAVRQPAANAIRSAKKGVQPQAAQPAQTLVAQTPVTTPAVQPKAVIAVDPVPTGSLSANNEPAAAGPGFRWPAHGRIIEGFKVGANDGINIALPEGTSIKAADDGVVAYAGSELKGYGNLVLIRHPNGFVTAYADNEEIDVKRGDLVKRGQVIAKSGQTGNVTSPQLHFELRKGSTPVDPTGFLAAL